MLDFFCTGFLLALHLLGLGCLGMAQDKHWQVVLSKIHCQRQPRVRLIGWGSLLLSLLLAWTCQGVAFGSLIWLLLLVPCGFIVTLILAWRPAWLRPLGRLLSRQGTDICADDKRSTSEPWTDKR